MNMYNIGNAKNSRNKREIVEEVHLSDYGEQILQSQERNLRFQTRLSPNKIIELERWLAKRSGEVGPMLDERPRVIKEYKLREISHTRQFVADETEIYKLLKEKYPNAIKWDDPQYHNKDGKGLQRIITSQVYGDAPFKRYTPPKKK